MKKKIDFNKLIIICIISIIYIVPISTISTDSNYNIYYSLSFSYEEFKQSQDRIHRLGQNNSCFYIILQANKTIETSIYRCLLNKKNTVDELYKEMSSK